MGSLAAGITTSGRVTRIADLGETRIKASRSRFRPISIPTLIPRLPGLGLCGRFQDAVDRRGSRRVTDPRPQVSHALDQGRGRRSAPSPQGPMNGEVSPVRGSGIIVGDLRRWWDNFYGLMGGFLRPIVRRFAS